MAKISQPHERRQFGRRGVCLHGWICVEGRPRLSCQVRDLSVAGARLELDVPAWLPFNFRLVIDASRFAADCEIRHQRDNGVGVELRDAADRSRACPRIGPSTTSHPGRVWIKASADLKRSALPLPATPPYLG